MRDFLLEQSDAQVASLINNITKLKELNTQIREDVDKLSILNDISTSYDVYKENNRQSLINKQIFNINAISDYEEDTKRTKNYINTFENAIVELNKKKFDLDNQKIDIDNEIKNLELARTSSDVSGQLRSLEEDREKKIILLESSNKKIESFSLQLQKEYQIAKEIGKDYKSKGVKDLINLIESKTSYSTKELQAILPEYHKDKNASDHALSVKRNEEDKNYRELSTRVESIEKELRTLDHSSFSYDSYIQKSFDTIREQLNDYYGKEIPVYPLCELLEINDPKYTNAIESMLGQSRFSLIIDPEFVHQANNIAFKEDIFNVSIIDTSRVEGRKLDNQSLAKKIDSINEYAKKFVEFSLGNYIVVERLEDLNNHHQSVFVGDNGFVRVYSGYQSRNLNKETFRRHYIGRKSREFTEAELIEELNQSKIALGKSISIRDSLSNLQNSIQTSRVDELIHSGDISLFDEVLNLRSVLVDLDRRIKSITSDPSLNKINQEYSIALDKKAYIQSSVEKTLTEMTEKRVAIENLRNALNVKELAIIEQKKDFKTAQVDTPDIVSAANNEFYALKIKHKDNYNAINREIETLNIQLQRENADKIADVKHFMKKYNDKYKYGIDTILENVSVYIQLRNKIRDDELINYQREATDLQEKTQIIFEESFVSHIKSSIINAQNEIDIINNFLSSKKFHHEGYQLICSKSSDPKYSEYYDIIMGSSSFEKNELFGDTIKKSDKAIMNELFANITSTDPAIERAQQMFLDYRNYMDYDIEVRNDETGDVRMFTSIYETVSGGESQTPYYIVIAASFEQLLSKNRKTESGCIVLFDEAFNKMDATRIEAIMNFYNNLSIQIMVAVPSLRAGELIPFCRTALLAKKSADGKYGTINELQIENKRVI
jgi:chromosome segregation ATPase